MKTKTLILLLLIGCFSTGCGSGKKEKPAYRSSSDTSSSQLTTPSADTLIKDTVMKDSAKNGTANP